MNLRAVIVRRNRPRGYYIPIEEAPALLACGWRLLDDCPALPGINDPRDEVLLRAPSIYEAAA